MTARGRQSIWRLGWRGLCHRANGKIAMHRLHELQKIYQSSPCLQDQTWRWGILIALLALMLIFGGD